MNAFKNLTHAAVLGVWAVGQSPGIAAMKHSATRRSISADAAVERSQEVSCADQPACCNASLLNNVELAWAMK